jgi:hypothetical protein
MTDAEFIELVKRNAPHIANSLLHVARVYGDPNRVVWKSGYPPNDMLINVSSGRVEVGKDCFFGHTVMLLTGTHDVTKFGPERVTSYPKEGRDIIPGRRRLVGLRRHRARPLPDRQRGRGG